MNAMSRYEVAEKLEEYGWAVVRYARRIKRAVEHPSPYNEAAAAEWYAECKRRLRLALYCRTHYLNSRRKP